MSKEVVAAVAAAEVNRLGRCPKCGKVLPEIANIPVYQCGSCLTTLQAKSRGGSRKASEINETNSTRLQSEFRNENSVEGPKALAREDPSCIEGSTGNAQEVHKDEVSSHQESKQNGQASHFIQMISARDRTVVGFARKPMREECRHKGVLEVRNKRLIRCNLLGWSLMKEGMNLRLRRTADRRWGCLTNISLFVMFAPTSINFPRMPMV